MRRCHLCSSSQVPRVTVAQFFDTAVGQAVILTPALTAFVVALWFVKATRPEGLGRHPVVVLVAHVVAFAAGLRLATHKFPAGPVLDRHGSAMYYYALILVLAFTTTQFFAWIICTMVTVLNVTWQEHEKNRNGANVGVLDEQNPYIYFSADQLQPPHQQTKPEGLGGAVCRQFVQRGWPSSEIAAD